MVSYYILYKKARNHIVYNANQLGSVAYLENNHIDINIVFEFSKTNSLS